MHELRRYQDGAIILEHLVCSLQKVRHSKYALLDGNILGLARAPDVPGSHLSVSEPSRDECLQCLQCLLAAAALVSSKTLPEESMIFTCATKSPECSKAACKSRQSPFSDKLRCRTPSSRRSCHETRTWFPLHGLFVSLGSYSSGLKPAGHSSAFWAISPTFGTFSSELTAQRMRAHPEAC